ncbi:MAG TPA: type II secretion system protein GspM [Myxococcota bacterium]|nr:type II secretion system protein GspM [Myxococcota bacterium]HRY94830.1 type II secretion system protein GspM [Myxococcota bacterium]HSA21753.1 type II secretion system protein GspM [Myxococcota bacterium]
MSPKLNRIENLTAALGRLSPRERVMVIGLVVAVLMFVGTLLALWISSSLSSLERRIADKTSKLETMLGVRQTFEEAKTVQKRSQDVMRRGREIQLMGMLETLAKQQGVNIGDMKQATPSVDTATKVRENKVEVNIKQITIDRLVEFLEELERRAKTVAIRKLHVRQNFQQPDQLEVSFTVSNFELLVEEEAPAPAAPSSSPAEAKAK